MAGGKFNFKALTRALGLCVSLGMASIGAWAQPAFGDKSNWTPAEQKMDSALIGLTRADRAGQLKSGRQKDLPASTQNFARDNVAPDDTLIVVIKADVTPDLTAFIRARGGVDVSEYPKYRTITARVPVSAVADIAERPEVQTIGPQERGTTNRESPARIKGQPGAGGAPLGGGNATVTTWEGVKAHKADIAHGLGYKGSGIKVCVMSDGVDDLAAMQSSGNLPAVTVLSGQGGSGYEGSAMLQIAHNMVPDASLYFATAQGGEAAMATNITTLAGSPNNCNIIVDDWTYFAAGAFQDGPVAQAVSTVTAAGAMYFSSAANSGNLRHGTSGTFEGDFSASSNSVPSSITTFYGAQAGQIRLQAFGSNNYTTLTSATSNIYLKWSDPLGGSANDYDLIVTNASNTILASSITRQSGSQDPLESVYSASGFPSGSRIYIVRYSGATRALRLDTNRGQITAADSTSGNTYGHNAAASAVTVAATDLRGLGGSGGVFTGGAANPVNTFSSDGPRKMFYNANGSPITAGNVLFGTNGGTTLSKVDLTAGNCGTTSATDFSLFCGTSAAAPTAAGIAAVIKSAKPAYSNAQILAAMKSSALDIEDAGWDVTSGAGITMVPVYTVGGSVSGLRPGKSIVLSNNGGDSMTIAANGNFKFATSLFTGANYAVTMGVQPPGQICSLANTSGTIGFANVGNVTVTCVDIQYTIGGTVSGLLAGKSVVLLNNGGDNLTVSANGNFTFLGKLVEDNTYAVTVGTQPPGQRCTVTNGSGTVGVANVTSVVVACVITEITGPTSTGTGMAKATIDGAGAACGFVLASSSFVAQPAAEPPDGVTFPHGFFQFTATACPAANGGATITVTYPKTVPPSARYYKYGKEVGNTTDHYYIIPATISGNQVTFTITDGQLGDNDLAANGTIVDPGAIGLQATLPIPSLSQYALWALALALLLIGMARHPGRRRR